MSEDFYVKHEAEGFVVLCVITEVDDYEGAADWVDMFDLTYPTVADVDWAVWDTFNFYLDRPYFAAIDRDMYIHFTGIETSGHDAAIEKVLELLAKK